MTLIVDDNLVIRRTRRDVIIDGFFGEVRPEGGPDEWISLEAGFYRLDENTLVPIEGGFVRFEDGWVWLPTSFGLDELSVTDVRLGRGSYKEIGVRREIEDIIGADIRFGVGNYHRIRFVRDIEEYASVDARIGVSEYKRLNYIREVEDSASGNARFGTGLYNLLRHIQETEDSSSVNARFGTSTIQLAQELTVSISNQSGSCMSYGPCTVCRTWTDSHVTAEGGVGNLSYHWQVLFGDATISDPSARNPEICHVLKQPQQTALSNLRLTVTDAWGNTGSDTATLTTNHNLPPDISVTANDISSSCQAQNSCIACANANLQYSGGSSDNYEFLYEHVSGVSASLPSGWVSNDSAQLCRTAGVGAGFGETYEGVFRVTVRDPANHSNSSSDTFKFTTTHFPIGGGGT